MLNKKAKSIIAMLLSLLMIIGMVPAMAFADEEDPEVEAGKEVNLLVLGNSTSSGYGMPDFTNRNEGFASLNNFLEEEFADDEDNPIRPNAWTYKRSQTNNPNGLARMSNAAYPWRLKKYIASQEGVDKVNLMPMTFNGMRTDELRAFLYKDFYENASAREYANAQKYIDETGASGDKYSYEGFLNAHMRWYCEDFVHSGVTSDASYDTASEFVQNNIKDADVIIVDLCGNNFGTYMGYRLGAYVGLGDNNRYMSNTYETIDDVEDLPDSLKNRIKSLASSVVGNNPLFQEGAGKQLLDIYLYSVADCIMNFRANMRWINQNKKDGARVIAVGLNNPMIGLKLDTGDREIDLGQLAGLLYDLVNTYIKGFDSNSSNYYYADIPDDLATFASSISDAESLEALLADGSNEDGLGAYAIERIYQDFVNEFMGGRDGDSKVVYSMIQDGIKAQAPEATFTNWDDLSGDNAKITFDPGTFYLTVDKAKLAQATDVDGVVSAIGFSPSAPAEDSCLTKGVVKQIAAMYYVSTANQGDLINTFGNMYCEAEGKTIGDIINDPTPFGQWVIGYLVANDMINNDQIAEAYGMIQDGVKAQAPNAGSFSELSETESVSFKPGTLYVTYNTQAQSLTESFNFSLTENISDEDQQKGIVLLTKGLIKQITAGSIKPVVQEMLYDAVNKHQTIDIAGIVEILESDGGMDAAAGAVTEYIAAKMQGQEADLGAFWGLITIEERFLLSSGVGEHPNATGCDQKYEIVKAAYESEETAYDQGMAEIKAMINDLVEMLRKTGAKDDIDAIIAKIAEIQAAMDMLDEAQASMEELKELQALKARLEEYFAEALDLLGITVDDLIAQGQFIADNIDPVWVAEQIRMINEIIENWPEMSEEYQAKIEEYYEKIMGRVDEIIDELIRQKDMFENSEVVKKIIETIEVLREVVKNMPKSEEEFKELALEQMNKVLDRIEEKAAKISEELAAQIKDIREKIDKAVTEGDYQALIDELLPIGEKLLAIGEAVSDLPEYRAAMDEYMETSQAAMDGLDERVTALEKQMGKLTAKSIEPELKTKLTFPKKKAKVTLSWNLDEDAAGYDVVVNGDLEEPYETKTGMAFAHQVKIGKTYKYEVTPYIFYEINGKTEMIYGKTVTKTFVPKVKLKKAVLKKVKAGKKSFKATWKKVAKADGYKLSYKVGKKTKTKIVKGAKKLSVTVKKLKKGKKYTVKVRAYKTVNGKKYYGAWSKAKKVKVK